MMKARAHVGPLVAVLLATGCSSRVTTPADTWALEAPPRRAAYGTSDDSAPVDRTRVHIVAPLMREEAQHLLAQDSSVELTPERAAELAGHALPDAPGTSPYLIRAT